MNTYKRTLVIATIIVLAIGGSVQASVSPSPKKVPVLKPSSAPKPSATVKPTTAPVYSAQPTAIVQKSVVKVVVSPSSAVIVEGKSLKLTASVSVKGGASQAVKWTSNSSVLKVVNGVVTAGKLPKGKSYLLVRITATSTWSPARSASSTIKVIPNVAVQRVTVKPTTLKLKLRQKGKVTATIYPANATNKSIDWASAKKTIASVDASGRVTANKIGTTTIYAISKEGSKTGSCKVIVTR